MTIKLLSFKLFMLFALTLASRCLGIQNKDVSFMMKLDNECKVITNKLNKSLGKGLHNPTIIYVSLPLDKSFCVTKTVVYYLNHYRGKLRERSNKSQVLISSINPH